MKLRVKKIEEQAKIPKYADALDAGMDLFTLEKFEIKPGERARARTGIAMEITDGYVGLIWDKSGLSNKHGLKILGGVIDASYRGEIIVGLVNLGSDPVKVEAGNKVAQMLIQKVEGVEFEVVEELDETARGDKGFGSTGK